MEIRHRFVAALIAAVLVCKADFCSADSEGSKLGWSAATSAQGEMPATAQSLQEIVKILEAAELRYYEKPKEPPTEPPVIPIQPLTPEELKKIIDHIRRILEDYGLRTLFDYDRDRDGKLSGDELREFLRWLIPCYDYIFTCEDRDKLIERYLKLLLCGNTPNCDPFQKKISVDDLLTWIDRWISFYERLLAACNSRPASEQAACRKPYEDALDSLKKLREEIRREAPSLTPRPSPTVSPVPSTSPAPITPAKPQVEAPLIWPEL